MLNSASESYKQAGVDIEAGYEAVRLMKKHIARTTVPGVLSELGGFGGLFALDLGEFSEPVLVSGTDGVGTKLKLAFLLDRHDTVGIDCVAMCINDILCSGARPLFFLDYIACGRNNPEQIAAVVSGIAEGCVQAGCALVGGETAEMPGFYAESEYDLAGFCVGAVNRSRIIEKSSVQCGDIVLGLPSSGVHSNGFSLIRRVFDLENHPEVLQRFEQTLGKTLGEALLEPTRIYVRPVLALMKVVAVHGLSHITGGGFYENIPRCLPEGLSVQIAAKDLPRPPIFDCIAEAGGLPVRDLYNTFNMGVGMAVIVAASDAARALDILNAAGEQAFVLGNVVAGGDGLLLELP